MTQDIAFAQNEISVAPGTTVTWENQDSVPHTATHGEDGEPTADALFDMPVDAGGLVSYTFDEPGTYSVTCTIHPDMNMTVLVEDLIAHRYTPAQWHSLCQPKHAWVR